MTHWQLQWLTIGMEHENREDSVVMGGIGPDGVRIMRGSTMVWPYNPDGSFNAGYQKQVSIMIGPVLIDIDEGAPISREHMREWVGQGFRHMNCRSRIYEVPDG